MPRLLLRKHPTATRKNVLCPPFSLIDGAVLTFVSITEAKKIQESLRESEEPMRIALTASPVVVFNQDGKLRYTWVYNPHSGFVDEQVIGKTDADLLPEEDAARLTTMKRAVLESGEGGRQQVRTTIKGRPFFYDLTVEPLRNTAAKSSGSLALAWTSPIG